MMFGRGSINGFTLNGFALNGGVFVEEVSSTESVGMRGSAPLVLRRAAVAVASISLPAIANLIARRRAPGAGAIALNADDIAVRRHVASGGSALELEAQFRLVRRATAPGRGQVSIEGRGPLSWYFIHRADAQRVLKVTEMRRLQVHMNLRHLAVPSRPAHMVAPRERSGRP